MKKLFSLLFIAFAFSAMAQKEISAKTVFEMIDKKQTIEYDGVTIVGDLDLTELSNKHSDKNNKWNNDYKSTVEVPISFKNCTFKGDFIAYKHIENGKRAKIGSVNINWSGDNGETFSTDFLENVVFENCKFERDSEFKYSNFSKNVSFGGAKFANQANFKYANFRKSAVFTKTDFDEYANFKYANFDKDVDFQEVKFRGTADFKYSNFDETVSFTNSNFKQHADFKYANFSNGVNFDKTAFDGTSDFKYSNGKRKM